MNRYIVSTAAATRDGYSYQGAVDLIADRHQVSQRQYVLAQVARIEARIELERAIQRGAAHVRPKIAERFRPHPMMELDEAPDRMAGVISAAASAALLVGFVMLAVFVCGGGS